MVNPFPVISEYDHNGDAVEIAFSIGTPEAIQRAFLRSAAEGLPIRHGGYEIQRSVEVNFCFVLRAEQLIWAALLYKAAEAFLGRLMERAADAAADGAKTAWQAMTAPEVRPIERLAEGITLAAQSAPEPSSVRVLLTMPGSFVEIEHSFEVSDKARVADHLARLTVMVPRIAGELSATRERGEEPMNFVTVRFDESGSVVLHWMDTKMKDRKVTISFELRKP